MTLLEQAGKLMKEDGAAIITAAEYNRGGVLERVQLYFWSGSDAAADIVNKDDLVQNFPEEEGCYALEDNRLKRVTMFEGVEDMYFRIDGTRTENDDLGALPTVRFITAVEGFSSLK